MAEDNSLTLFEVNLADGESQKVEFKEQIPESVQSLAKVIASFATSNTGTIYLGVDDSGNVVGVNDIDAPVGKDEFQKRMLGIVSSVNPSIRVDISFFQKNSKNLARIIVPKGSEPVYYVGGIPYLRDLSSSRKAEPEEVKELHQMYFERQGFTEVENKQQLFLNHVITQLSDAEIALSDMEDHNVNPYLEQLLYDLGTTGQSLLNLSADPLASSLQIDNDLKNIGKKLQDMENHEFFIGKTSWDAFLEKGKEASMIINRLLPRVRKNTSTNENSKKEFVDMTKRAVNNLRTEWEVGRGYRYGSELEKIRNSFRILGFTFHRLTNLSDADDFNSVRKKMLELGSRLRTLYTPKKFGYGGLGFNHIEHIQAEVNSCIELGEAIVADLETT